MPQESIFAAKGARVAARGAERFGYCVTLGPARQRRRNRAAYPACRSKGQISWCFLTTLPTNDSDAMTSSNYTASASVTRLIQVTVATGDIQRDPSDFGRVLG